MTWIRRRRVPPSRGRATHAIHSSFAAGGSRSNCARAEGTCASASSKSGGTGSGTGREVPVPLDSEALRGHRGRAGGGDRLRLDRLRRAVVVCRLAQRADPLGKLGELGVRDLALLVELVRELAELVVGARE